MSQEELKNILKDAYGKIQTLIIEEKWIEAHRACLEILRFDPDNLKFIRLKNRIEKEVKKINIKAIKTDLDKLQPLWREKKYEELLEHLKQLEPYINDYPPLKDIILKAQNEYKNFVLNDQKKYFKVEMARIEQLLNQKEFQECIRAAQKLRILKYHEGAVKDLLKKIRTAWVDDELLKNKALLASSNYEDILIFLQGLYRMDSKSVKVNNLMNSVKKKYNRFKIEKKRDFIYEGEEKLRTLVILKKFDKAAQAAQEILNIDPYNKTVKNIYIKSIRRETKKIDKELIKQMKKAQKMMKDEYKNNKKNFVRI